MSLIHAYNAQALLDINPQSIDDLEIGFSSLLVSSSTLEGHFFGCVKWAAKVIRHPITCINISQVLQDTCLEVDSVVRLLLQGSPGRLFQEYEYRICYMNQWRELLSKQSLDKLRVIFARFKLSLVPIDAQSQNKILSLRAMADVETALRAAFPVELFHRLSMDEALSSAQKVELQSWFLLFHQEAGFITPSTLLYTLQGSLLVAGGYTISSLSTLVWRLKSMGFISFNRLDQRTEEALRRFHTGGEIIGQKRYVVEQRASVDSFGEYDLESYTTLSGPFLLTSDNPFKLLTWYGALQQCAHVAPSIRVLDFDPEHRWCAIERFEDTLDQVMWHQPFSCRVHGSDLPLLRSLSTLVQSCMNMKVSKPPEPKMFIVVQGEVKTFVPCAIDTVSFSLTSLAQWVYHAVGRDPIRYREVMQGASVDQHAHYTFFSSLFERVLFEKDRRSIVEIADSFAIDSRALRTEAEQYALTLHRFKCQCLKQLRGLYQESELIQIVGAFLRERHLLFFVDTVWIPLLKP